MKPTSQIPTSAQIPEVDRRAIRSHAPSPLTDYNFHANISGSSGRAPAENKPSLTPALWTVSRDFFRTEATRHFLWEASFFVVIVLITAWPIASLIEVLARSIK